MGFDWANLARRVLPEVIGIFKDITKPVEKPVDGPTVPVKAGPSPAVKSLQHILNQTVKPQPPLTEDGWLGDRTEKAILDGIAMAEPYLSMLGK